MVMSVGAFAQQQFRGTKGAFLRGKEPKSKESKRHLLHSYIQGKGIARTIQIRLQNLRERAGTTDNCHNDVQFPWRILNYNFSRPNPSFTSSLAKQPCFIMIMIYALAA